MPLLHVLESRLVFFLLFAWVWVVIQVIGDVMLSRDMSGFAKGISVLFIIAIPWLGLLCYLIIRGKGMGERKHTHSVAGFSTADELLKLAELKDKGVITDAEFDSQKAKLL